MRGTGPNYWSKVHLSGFDYFVLAGAGVNLLVVGYLVGHWFAAG